MSGLLSAERLKVHLHSVFYYAGEDVSKPLTAHIEALETKVAELTSDVDDARRQRDEALADNAKQIQEVARLRAVLAEESGK